MIHRVLVNATNWSSSLNAVVLRLSLQSVPGCASKHSTPAVKVHRWFKKKNQQFQSTSQEKDDYCCTAQLLWGVATSTPCYSLNRDTQKRSCYNDKASPCKTKQNWLRKVVFSVPKTIGPGDRLVPCRLVQHFGPNYTIFNTGRIA